MTIGIALVVIFVLYLIDKHNRWWQAVKVAVGLVIVSVIGFAAFIGYEKIQERREAKRQEAEWRVVKETPAFDPNAPYSDVPTPPPGFKPVIEIRGGETLRVVSNLPMPKGFEGGSQVPLLYFGHRQTITIVCGNFGERGTFGVTNKNGEVTCP